MLHSHRLAIFSSFVVAAIFVFAFIVARPCNICGKRYVGLRKRRAQLQNKTRNVNLGCFVTVLGTYVCVYICIPFCTFFIKLKPTFGIVLPLNTKVPMVHKARRIHSTQLWVHLPVWVSRFCNPCAYIHLYMAYVCCLYTLPKKIVFKFLCRP